MFASILSAVVPPPLLEVVANPDPAWALVDQIKGYSPLLGTIAMLALVILQHRRDAQAESATPKTITTIEQIQQLVTALASRLEVLEKAEAARVAAAEREQIVAEAAAKAREEMESAARRDPTGQHARLSGDFGLASGKERG